VPLPVAKIVKYVKDKEDRKKSMEISKKENSMLKEELQR